MDWCPIRGVFLPQTHCSWVLNPPGSDQDKVVNKDE